MVKETYRKISSKFRNINKWKKTLNFNLKQIITNFVDVSIKPSSIKVVQFSLPKNAILIIYIEE